MGGGNRSGCARGEGEFSSLTLWANASLEIHITGAEAFAVRLLRGEGNRLGRVSNLEGRVYEDQRRLPEGTGTISLHRGVAMSYCCKVLWVYLMLIVFI